MPRKLNPNYLRRTIRKDVIRDLEFVILVGERFGVSTSHPERRDEYETLINTPGRLLAIPANYRGWIEPGKLYCVKCWGELIGVPREIILANRCENCDSRLYSHDDARLDQFGYEIYRNRVSAFTGVAVRRFRSAISGNEHLMRNGVADGFHKDHIFAIRAAFEQDVEEAMISSPANIRVMEGAGNLSKGRKSELTLEELTDRYHVFLAEHPNWIDEISAFEMRQKTFTRMDWLKEIERARKCK